MKLALGLIPADKGAIYVKGERVQFGENKTNRYIGYLPDVPEFYKDMTPGEYLRFCGKIAGMDTRKAKKKSEELLDMVGLLKANKRIGGFSRGMKQRLGIAQALLNSPALLLCDEPTSALDPAGRREILDILQVVKEQTTILFSTHILSDVERICDKVALLDKGKIVLQDSLEKLKHRYRKRSIELEFYHEKDADFFCKMFAESIRTGQEKVECRQSKEEETLEIMRFLVQNKISVLHMKTREPALEDLFLEVAGA